MRSSSSLTELFDPGCWKDSKPHSDFRFVVHLSPLYGLHMHRN